jgi:tetratricopeptide (TPR) repeat protein
MLGRLYDQQARYGEAEEFVRRQMALDRDVHDGSAASFLTSLKLGILGALAVKRQHDEDAVGLYREALAELDLSWVCELDTYRGDRGAPARWTLDHSRAQMRASWLDCQAGVLKRLGRSDEAERSYREAMDTIRSLEEISLPPGAASWPFRWASSRIGPDSTLASVLKNYASLLRKLGRRREAADLSRRSREITGSVEERRQANLEAQRAQTLPEQ